MEQLLLQLRRWEADYIVLVEQLDVAHDTISRAALRAHTHARVALEVREEAEARAAARSAPVVRPAPVAGEEPEVEPQTGARRARHYLVLETAPGVPELVGLHFTKVSYARAIWDVDYPFCVRGSLKFATGSDSFGVKTIGEAETAWRARFPGRQMPRHN